MQSSVSLWVLFGVFLLCNGICEKGVYENVVNNGDKSYIVNEHNRLRLLIAHGAVMGQPRGINLKRMYWDEKLAQQAQNMANTCIYQHVRISDPRWSVGQNIAASYTTNFVRGANWSEPISNWWKEYQVYTFGNGFSTDTGHYTQMAWDDTQYVGCGYSFFEGDGEYKYQKLYVCNYGPSGNYPRAPYQTGTQGCENLC